MKRRNNKRKTDLLASLKKQLYADILCVWY